MSKYFTDEEKEYIFKNRLKIPIKQIAEKINRQTTSIQYFLIRNKLSYINKISQKNNQELTERQKEVLRLISLGYSNADIADELVITLDTVKTHLNAIYNKLNLNRSSRDCSVMRVRAVLKYLNLETKSNIEEQQC